MRRIEGASRAGRPSRSTNTIKIKSSQQGNTINTRNSKTQGIGQALGQGTKKINSRQRAKGRQPNRKRFEQAPLKNRGRNKTLDSLHKSHNSSHIFSSCTAVIFMAATKQNRIRQQRRLNKQGSASFGAVKLVTANRNQVCVKLVDVVERLLAKPLHSVRVKTNPKATTNSTQRSYRLNRSGLIVGSHDRNQDSIVMDSFHQILWVNAPIRINREYGLLKPLIIHKIFNSVQNRVMLHSGGYYVPPFRLQKTSRSADCLIDALCSATCENNLACFTFPYPGNSLPGVIQ